MTLIDRYILRTVLGMTGLVVSVLLVLAALFTFIGEQGDVGQGRYTELSALTYAALNLPQQMWELLPIAALIGSLLGLGVLARGSELTVLRSSGVSVARIAGSVVIAGLVLVALEVILGELLAPPLEQAAKHMKAFERFSNVSFGSGGAWVRDGNLILNVEELAGTRQFGSMLLFELSPDHKLRAIGYATRARAAQGKRWLLSDYAESRFTPDGESAGGYRVLTQADASRTLDSNISASVLELATAAPRELRTRALWSLIEYYRANSLDPRAYLFAFWSRIARTVAIVFATLLAIPFVLGPLRSAGTGSRMMVGIGLGLAFFFMQRLIESGTIVFDLNPVVLAWLPTSVLALLTIVLVARAR